MRNFYAFGPVYIWIKTNNVNRLGTECIVTGNIQEWTCVDTGKPFFGQQTDSEQDNGFPVCALWKAPYVQSSLPAERRVFQKCSPSLI